MSLENDSDISKRSISIESDGEIYHVWDQKLIFPFLAANNFEIQLRWQTVAYSVGGNESYAEAS